MSKMFDYISGKADGEVARLEAECEHALGYLELELEENQKLRDLLNDDNYIRWRADYARGHLSWANMIAEREAKAGFIRASADNQSLPAETKP